MALEIDPDRATERIDEFIEQIDDLLEKRYTEGKEEKRRMSTKLDNFVTVAFSDGEEKKNSLYPSVVSSTFGGKSAAQKQREYEDSLKRKRNHLEAWKEQIELEKDLDSAEGESNEESSEDQDSVSSKDYKDIEREISSLNSDLPLYANDLEQSLIELRNDHHLASVMITGRVIDYTIDQIKSSQNLGGPEEVLDHLEENNIVDARESQITEVIKLYRDEYTHEVGKSPGITRAMIILLGCTELLHSIQQAGKSEEYDLA